jgi:hypothetical protein
MQTEKKLAAILKDIFEITFKVFRQLGERGKYGRFGKRNEPERDQVEAK